MRCARTPEAARAGAGVLHLSRPAMATRFELWVVGDEPEQLEAVGTAALDEVLRVERLLSRFDPAAELARVNREAPAGRVLVDRELFAVLEDCLRRHEETGGFFDIAAARHGGGRGPLTDSVRLDPAARTVEFLDAGVRLDLGGYGKGYALDLMAQVLDRYGVESALMHGGTSSILARGRQVDGLPWQVGIRDPFAPGDARLREIPLRDAGLSYSAVLSEPGGVSDILDPHSGEPLREQAACVVEAPTATEAEVYSTALLAMGREVAEEFLRAGRARTRIRAGWIDRVAGEVALRWWDAETEG